MQIATSFLLIQVMEATLRLAGKMLPTWSQERAITTSTYAKEVEVVVLIILVAILVIAMLGAGKAMLIVGQAAPGMTIFMRTVTLIG